MISHLGLIRTFPNGMKNMTAISNVSNAIRMALFATSGVALLASPGVYAEEEQIERIEVTGSKIKRIGELSPTPITVITGAQKKWPPIFGHDFKWSICFDSTQQYRDRL